ncbi:hypothetical protein UXA55_00990 [Aeromonas caviae]|uniref:hypothetical protein n=1 Tax=Aeromonas TaxID=642 RepID=UPI0006508D7A|nr:MULTISPECIES: hypothetical protein [Aeromonas]KLV46270.1 hypothetical protein SH16_01755 [Aeromonas caviae]MDU7582338.1 hypothetical protein [Aeromonas sp.]MDX7851110.1 hypothetical protein [Aeromonas caviae]MDY7828160.1 hypothetical protein [Aeromonas caviae]MEE1913352.1 hypothetical protein [Aeromonas caviae]
MQKIHDGAYASDTGLWFTVEAFLSIYGNDISYEATEEEIEERFPFVVMDGVKHYQEGALIMSFDVDEGLIGSYY